jgi:mRNA interferase RelE/StbE
MIYRIILHTSATDEIRKLPAKIKASVKECIDSLASTPVPSTAIRLRGRKNAYRIRLGRYRMIYEVHASEIVVYVIGIAHRKDVYTRLLRRR